MILLSRFAGPLSARFSTVMIAFLLGASPVAAQKAPAQQPPRQQRPAAKDQPAQPQNAGPIIVQVKAEPSQPEWTKVCGNDQPNQPANAQICYTTRDFVSDTGQRVLAVALYDLKGQPSQKTLRILIPLGLLLPPGLRVSVDQGVPVAGHYAVCFPTGCFAEATVKGDFITALKKGTTLNVSTRNQVGREVTFAVPAEGFGKAFDGPPIDPKVLEERQKKVQEELRKRAEELRQQQMNNPGNPAQGPAAGASPAAPKP